MFYFSLLCFFFIFLCVWFFFFELFSWNFDLCFVLFLLWQTTHNQNFKKHSNDFNFWFEYWFVVFFVVWKKKHWLRCKTFSCFCFFCLFSFRNCCLIFNEIDFHFVYLQRTFNWKNLSCFYFFLFVWFLHILHGRSTKSPFKHPAKIALISLITERTFSSLHSPILLFNFHLAIV